MKRRGVSIETDIEYRVGPYFVLAVNVTKVDWRRLVKSAHRDVAEATRRWRKELEERDEEYADELPQGVIMSFLVLCYGLTKLTKFEVMAQLLAWCHYLHWVVYVPICHLLYHTVLGELFRRYFLATITDGKNVEPTILYDNTYGLVVWLIPLFFFIFKKFSIMWKKRVWRWILVFTVHRPKLRSC